MKGRSPEPEPEPTNGKYPALIIMVPKIIIFGVLVLCRVARGRGFLKKPRPRITEAGKAEIEVEGLILTRDRGRGPRITEVFKKFYNLSKST